MIDDQLNPWLLEVNLSPSLTASSGLDQRIKAGVVSDVLNLARITNVNYLRDNRQRLEPLKPKVEMPSYPSVG